MAGMQNRPWQSPDATNSYNSGGGGQFDGVEFHPHRGTTSTTSTTTTTTGHHHPRGSLGLFIERSTSAPPPSSTFFGTSSLDDKFGRNGGALVGNDLLQCVTGGYGDMSLKNGHKMSDTVSNSSNGDNEDEFGAVWMEPGDRNDTADEFMRGSAGARSIGSMGLSMSRPLSASGDAFNSSMENRHSLLHGDLTLASLGAGQVRSHSAAPSTGRTSLGPPPGLVEFSDDSYSSSSLSSKQQHQINQWGHNVRRPASAGVLTGGGGSIGGGATTLRPAAKTLMDLIQEDSSPEDNRINNDLGRLADQGNNSRNQMNGVGSFGMDLYGRTSSSPVVVSQRQQSTGSTAQNQISPAGMGVYVAAPSPHQYQHQYPLQQQQQLQDDAFGGVQRGYQQQSHSVEQQHNSQNMIHQLGGMSSGGIIRQVNEEAIQNPNMYAQVQPQQTQQQQHIYYNGQRIELPHGIQAQSLQNQGLQATHGMHPQGIQSMQQMQGMQPTQTIQLPNGQTVYVNTSPPPQQPYGYTTVQYHAPSPHGHMIQQSLQPGHGNEGGQYVSVVPVQGGPPVTYWQPSGVSVHPSTVGISNAGGVGGPVTISRVHSPGDIAAVMQQQQMHGGQYGGGSSGIMRGREKGGGRGRRGANVNANTSRRGGDTKVSSVPVSSALLEEFRLSKSRDWTMRRIEGHVVEFSQDQNGSRFIQQRLEMGDISEQQIVMNEVLPAIRRLRNDVFGNYVVQKLLDFGTVKMKADIQSTLEGEMVPLSLQMYGCRVVQKALEALSEDDLPRMLQEFHNNVLNCIHDQNGNHVIQKCIEILNTRANKANQVGDVHRAAFLAEQIDFVVDDVLANTTTLSCHPYGCRVLQRILEHCADAKKMKILDEIKKCHEKLLDDQYGNYVIQHVLQFGRDEDRDSILDIVVKNGLLALSRQKFASNVVEKLLKYGNSYQRCAVVREMLKKADDPSIPSDPSDGSNSVVLLMVRDAYANYVVQTTLDVVPESDEKQKLLEELNSHSEELRNYTFAKHIVAKLSSLNGGS